MIWIYYIGVFIIGNKYFGRSAKLYRDSEDVFNSNIWRVKYLNQRMKSHGFIDEIEYLALKEKSNNFKEEYLTLPPIVYRKFFHDSVYKKEVFNYYESYSEIKKMILFGCLWVTIFTLFFFVILPFFKDILFQTF